MRYTRDIIKLTSRYVTYIALINTEVYQLNFCDVLYLCDIQCQLFLVLTTGSSVSSFGLLGLAPLPKSQFHTITT